MRCIFNNFTKEGQLHFEKKANVPKASSEFYKHSSYLQEELYRKIYVASHLPVVEIRYNHECNLKKLNCPRGNKNPLKNTVISH